MAEYLTSNLLLPFIWGQQDCVLFAARWVQLATGRDYLSDIDPWGSKIEALRVMKRGGGLKAIVDRKLTRIAPEFANDGDIAFHQRSLRIFSGHHICGPSREGLIFLDRMAAVCAWRLPNG